MIQQIQMALQRIRHRVVARTWQGTGGSISVETVIVMPVVILALALAFTFTDAFRHLTSLQKSVHTAADIVSRASGNAMTPDYLDGIFRFMQRMNDSDQELRMRMSLIGWDDEEEEFRVIWSHGSPAVTTNRLDDITLNLGYSDIIPMISPGETLLMVEGLLFYEPPFRVGLAARPLAETTLVRPRFAPGIAFNDPTAPPPPDHWCVYIIDACGM